MIHRPLTYIHTFQGPGRSIVYAAADPRSACLRGESPKFPFFFWFSTSQKCAFCQIVNKSRILPYKKLFKNKSVNFRLRRARPDIRRLWTCSRPHTYMHLIDPQYDLLWSNCYGSRSTAPCTAVTLVRMSDWLFKLCQLSIIFPQRLRHFTRFTSRPLASRPEYTVPMGVKNSGHFNCYLLMNKTFLILVLPKDL